jgi:hypothetical protein
MSRGVPSRDDGGSGRQLLVVALALGAVLFTAVPAASFTTATVSRGANVGVVNDESGVTGLDVRGFVFCSGPVVTVTNNLPDAATATVSLDNGQSVADLRGPDGDIGDSVSFGLASGESGTVAVETDARGTLRYTVETTSGPTDFEAQRSSLVIQFFC